MIKELTKKTLGKSKAGWTWDKKRKLFYTFQIDTEIGGARHIRRGFRSEQAAIDYLDKLAMQKKLKEIGVVQIIKFPKVKDLFQRHRKTIESARAQTTFDRVTKSFLSLLPSQNITLDELKRKHFKDFADNRIKEGIKAESANREITDISAAIHKAGDYFENLENWSVPEKLIYRPVFEQVERTQVWTRGERESLIKYLLREKEAKERSDSHLARRRSGLLLYFAFLTSLRHSELSALKKSNFSRADRRLLADRFKTKKKGVSVTIFEPLTDLHIWILTEAETLYPDGEYFFSAKGKLQIGNYVQIKKACEHLDIPYGADGGLVIHDARHTFVTEHDHAGTDRQTTRSFSGHSADAMADRYSHATFDSRSRAMSLTEKQFAIEGFGSEKKEDVLKAVFEAVRSGEMSLAEFKKSLEDSFTVFLH